MSSCVRSSVRCCAGEAGKLAQRKFRVWPKAVPRAWADKLPHTSRPLSTWVPVVHDDAPNEPRFMQYDLFSRLLKERIVYCWGEINASLALQVTAQLLFLDSKDPHATIHMWINSPGGSISQGLAIYDTMQHITAKVETTVMGQAASMGSLLLAAGAPGMRFALPNAQIMLHQPLLNLGGGYNKASDLKIVTEEILKTRHRLNGIYCHHTKRPIEQLEQVMVSDYHLDADQAVEFGIVDAVRRPSARSET